MGRARKKVLLQLRDIDFQAQVLDKLDSVVVVVVVVVVLTITRMFKSARGHRTGSSHSGEEEYPTDKHKPKLLHA